MTRPVLLLIVLLVTLASLNALPQPDWWFSPYLEALAVIAIVALFQTSGADDDA